MLILNAQEKPSGEDIPTRQMVNVCWLHIESGGIHSGVDISDLNFHQTSMSMGLAYPNQIKV